MRKPRDPVYSVWGAIIQRCTNPKNKQFADYGGRGITVCDRWRVYSAFAADMGPRPPGMTVERINNDRGYSPDNCCWATRKEQNSNKRNCIYVVVHQGKRVTLREFCRLHDLRYRPIVKRIQDRGWPVDLAVHVPVGSDCQNELLFLWDENQQLRDYLRLALNAAAGRPTIERLLNDAWLLCDAPPQIKAAA